MVICENVSPYQHADFSDDNVNNSINGFVFKYLEYLNKIADELYCKMFRSFLKALY